MSRKKLAAAMCAAAIVWGTGTSAIAGDGAWPSDTPFSTALSETGLELSAGPWTFGPMIAFGPPNDGYAELTTASGPSTAAELGFRGAARVDSRIGTLYSRLSVSFQHEFQANDHLVVTGLSGAGRYGFYGDRSDVDVVAADAALALRMSEAVFGYLEYGTEVEAGATTEHQVTLRLRFAF